MAFNRESLDCRLIKRANPWILIQHFVMSPHNRVKVNILRYNTNNKRHAVKNINLIVTSLCETGMLFHTHFSIYRHEVLSYFIYCNRTCRHVDVCIVYYYILWYDEKFLVFMVFAMLWMCIVAIHAFSLLRTEFLHHLRFAIQILIFGVYWNVTCRVKSVSNIVLRKDVAK